MRQLDSGNGDGRIVERLEASHGSTALILTDFELPNGFTGDKIVDEIAAHLRSSTPTIMLTSGTGDLHGKAKLDVDRILAKPVDIKLLVREIELLLGIVSSL